MRELWWNNLCKFVAENAETLSVLIVILYIHYLVKKNYASPQISDALLKKNHHQVENMLSLAQKKQDVESGNFSHMLPL